MKNRLMAKVREAKRKRRKLFCAFLTLGYPGLQATENLIKAFEKEGVDILELGFPFSDPLADGPTIQFSSEHAIRQGVQLEDAFRLVSKLRRDGLRMPVLFFTYANPVFHFGWKKFVSEIKASGFDGVIVPDLPPDEEKTLQKECRKKKLCQVFLVTPTTTPARARMITRASEGFIYYVSLRGVTGARKALPADIRNHLRKLTRLSSKPVLVGFGISTPDQARDMSRISGGVIVGSAIIEALRHAEGRPDPALHLVRRLSLAVHGKRHDPPRS